MDKITFTEHGAAECVDGSKGVVQIGPLNVGLDFGRDYKNQPKAKDKEFPYDVSKLDCAFLSHAHGDHGGANLELVMEGFNKKIYATHQTYEIQHQQNAQEAYSSQMGNKSYNDSIKGRKFTEGPHKGEYLPFKKGVFSYEDTKKAMSMYDGDVDGTGGFAYGKEIKINDILSATFYDAGHIPGSAQILFDMHLNGKNYTLLTACDLGRTDYRISGHPVADIPIVRAPEKNFPKPIDHIILEATYGAKVHKPLEESVSAIYDAIQNTAKNSGTLIIPAFSIMRTHIVSVILYDFYKSGKLPENMDFYISSPSADQVSKIIMKHPEDMDKLSVGKFQNKKDNPFFFDRLIHHKKYEETQAIIENNNGGRPYAIIGASGMCDMGRIVSILRSTVSNPNTTVALLGYQAEGTRGYQLLNKAQTLKFEDEIVPVKASVINVSGFSGHVDCVEAIAHLQHINTAFPGHHLKTINIKHGEKEQCYALAQKIREAGFSSSIIRVLKKGQTVMLE
jgi:metallo-beta-lactamase family protein